MRESIIKKKTIKILQFVNNTIPNLERYCSPILKVLEFETCDVEDDDTRKYTTLYSSMMGRPDLRPQPVKVRTRKTHPE